ncbi:MAG: phosphate ABC transporter permease PstA [Verrucomicrobiota bacterium]
MAHTFSTRPTKAKTIQSIAFWAMRFMAYTIVILATLIFGTVFWKGGSTLFQSKFPFVNTTFLLDKPETLHVATVGDQKLEMGDQEWRAFEAKNPNAGVEDHKTFVYSAGGIFPCIVGTVLLVIGSMTIALILGVMSAIYLSEYSKQGPFIEWVRISIANLAGVPSIVFGLFGYGIFVIFFGWNVSLLSGWFTLAFMVLPVIITASEEALRAVPKGFREGSLALGATKWQTIMGNVLPYALPGILTSSVLSIARVAGETAPIMFTAAYVVRDELPWEVKKFTDFFFQGVQALPYHIYVVSSKIPQNEYTARVQWGGAFVFLVVVLAITFTAMVMRSKMRQKYRW